MLPPGVAFKNEEPCGGAGTIDTGTGLLGIEDDELRRLREDVDAEALLFKLGSPEDPLPKMPIYINDECVKK